MLALTLKDAQQSGYFTHIQKQSKESVTLLSGLWDGTWASLLLYACDAPLLELSRLGYSAGLLMESQFVPCGLWGDKQLAARSFKDVFAVPRRNQGRA